MFKSFEEKFRSAFWHECGVHAYTLKSTRDDFYRLQQELNTVKEELEAIKAHLNIVVQSAPPSPKRVAISLKRIE